MKLVVGLGNPGKKYKNSKHNIGFMALDSYAATNKSKFKKSVKFSSEILVSNDYILLKPKTFMNNSGMAVNRVVEYYNIDLNDVLIIFDDLNLSFARLRLRPSGSAGGHNGIKSIIANLSSQSFNRLRVGIGRNANKDMKDDVLSNFSKLELNALTEINIDIANIIEQFVSSEPFEVIMNRFNSKE